MKLIARASIVTKVLADFLSAFYLLTLMLISLKKTLDKHVLCNLK